MKTEVFKIVEKKPKQPKIDFAVTGMPEGYEVAYLGSIDSETYFVIYRPEQFAGYTVWKAAIGPQDSMEVCEVHRVDILRDGGTVKVFTERGIFMFPSPFTLDKDVKPLFEGKTIQLIFSSKV